jgi:hypothetical protein
MKRKTVITAQDSTDKVRITIEHQTSNLPRETTDRNHSLVVNVTHDALRNHFSAHQIKIKQ